MKHRSRESHRSSSAFVLRRLALLFLVTFSITVSLQAQLDTGTIQGIVKDQSGAVIPGAKVTLINEGTGLTLEMATGPTGYYLFPALRIGTYRIEVEAKGFEKFVQPNQPLHVQEAVVVDATLVPGAVTQTIVVKAAAPLLQTQNATVGQVIGTTMINDLPLNGRDFTTLALTITGVSVSTADSSLNRPFFNSSGHPNGQNDYRLNGINNNDEAFVNPEPYVSLPPPDALAEFKLQTDNYSAEFGHSAGAIINATTKAGTNKVHGDLWEFVRNDKFDAAQFFQNTANQKKASFRQNQFGGSLGGPLVLPHVYNGKDKTFFFGDYQGTRIRQPAVSTDSVPTASEASSGFTNLQDMITYQNATRTDSLGRKTPLGTVFDPATTRNVTAGQADPVTGLIATTSGFVRDPFYQGSISGITDFTTAAAIANLNILPKGRLDQNAVKLLSLYPTPQRLGIISNYTYPAAVKDGKNSFDFRFDQNFSSRDQLFVTGDWYHRSKYQPGSYPGVAGDAAAYPNGYQDMRGVAYAISETHAFSATTINEARLGYSYSPMYYSGSYGDTMGIPAQYGIQGIPQYATNGGLPPIGIAGLTAMGEGAYIPQIAKDTNWDLTDNLTKVRGAHTLKVGFQGDLIVPYVNYAKYPRGTFAYSGTYTEVANTTGGSTGMAQLLLSPIASTVPGGFANVGGPNSVSVSTSGFESYKRTYMAGYFQDDWKVTRKLTANLGVRWDRYSPYEERYGAEATFLPGADGSQARYIFTQRRCNEPRSASFVALTQQDGVAVQCSDNAGLGTTQNDLFSPRLGLSYRLANKLVLRAGYGLFYGDAAYGAGNQDGSNYPFIFALGYSALDAAHPVVLPNGTNTSLESMGTSLFPISSTGVNAKYLGWIGTEWKTHAPYFNDYNLTLQYQPTPHQSFQLAYVGNAGFHLVINSGANWPSVLLPPGLNGYNYVPYPDFAAGSTYYTYSGKSDYNSLQATFERTFSGGLNFNANYTFSKCRTDTSSRGMYLPGYGLKPDYQPCGTDIPNLMHFSGLYQLPVGRGMHFLRNGSGPLYQILGGWRINWIATLMDGLPFSVGCPVATTTWYGCAAFLVPGQNIYGGPHNINQWLNPAAFAQPPKATTVGQTDYSPLGGKPGQAHGPGLHRVDFSMFKEFPVAEGKRFEFRAEMFNLTNTPWFNNPAYLDFTNTVTFGRINSLRDGANDPRQIQLALKFYW